MLGFRLLNRQPPRRLQQELVHPLVLVRRLGDSRYPDTWAARHSLLFAERLEDELEGVTYEDSYELDDDEHDLDARRRSSDAGSPRRRSVGSTCTDSTKSTGTASAQAGAQSWRGRLRERSSPRR